MTKCIKAAALAATLGVAVLSTSAFAAGGDWYTAVGTDRKCRSEPYGGPCHRSARDAAYNLCRASGCQLCSFNAAFNQNDPNFICSLETNPGNMTCSSRCLDVPACAAAPTITVSVSPTTIWPPNNKPVTLTLSGTISAPVGCTLSGATFSLVDSEGTNNSSGALTLSGGSFSTTVQVPASRLGANPNGRTYTVTVSASDSAGSGSASATSTVPHDQGKK